MAAAARTEWIFAAANAVLGSVGPIAISMGGLAGAYLLDADKSLATAPVTGFNVGTALGALPAAALIRRLGQRSGFQWGTGVTLVGGVVATIGLFAGSFWMFGFGLMLLGSGNAFVQQFRFAAADNAPTERKARAISFVLAGGVVTAVLGPQIVIFTRDLLAPVMFAGSFAAVPVLALAGALILSQLPACPLVLAAVNAGEVPPRPLRKIIAQPRFAVALFCAVASYALMSFVMTGAPLAMVGCGFSADQATLGISFHVMAMFGPSFFTGRLIGRYGANRITTAGLALLLACAVVALSGIALWQFWAALVLLGLGWNFGFIGATAMVAGSYLPSEKGRAQGFHDLVLFGSVATASLLSGVVFNAAGWNTLAWTVFPVALAALAALGVLTLTSSKFQTI